MVKFENHCPRRILLTIIIARCGKLGEKWASPKDCGNAKDRGQLGLGVQQSFLEEVMGLGSCLKGRA